MKGTADTSWLYAIFDESDRHHEQARSQLAKATAVQVPPTILAETLDLIQYRAGKDAAVRALEDLRNVPTVHLEADHDVEPTIALWRRHRSLTYADASAVASAAKVKIGLFTFDAKQRRALQT